MREILHAVVQGLRERLDEGTAAGGTCLVQLYAVYGAVFDLDALHILAADVENTVDFRIEECGSVIMGNRLYLTLVQHQCSFDERLAVTGRTGPGDLCGIRQFGVDLLDRADRCAERISVVVAVEGIEKSTVFADESSFGRRGTGINTEIAVSFVGGKIGGHDVVDTLARQKFVILGLIFKQRLKTGNLKIDSNFLFEPFFQCEKGNFGFSVCIHRRTDGCKQVGVVRYDNMFIIQLQGSDKSSLQLRKEVKRPAKEGNVSADRFTAGKTRNGLVDNCLENGSGKILFCCTVVDERLDIGFCEYTAACCDRINRLVMLRVFVESGCIGLQKRSHLVDERTGAAGADTVHTLLHIAAFKIDDLGILTAELDGNVGLRSECF